ncbi:tetratricopeptide repeat protein [Gimesia sp.]|uniref:tetratricopeptide repeat protein n=1 Tax=Gimesia sp. TaxID=2024833 RepID=UPI003A904E70
MSDTFFNIFKTLFLSLMMLFCVTANTALLQAAADGMDSADVKTLLKTAYDHQQHGRYEESREVYDKATALLGKTSPPDAEQHLKLQRGLIELDRLTGKSRAALQRVEAAIKQAPERPLLHAIGAQLCYESGDYKQAHQYVSRALALDADQPLAHLIQAHLLTDAGKIDEANEGYRWFVRYYNRAQPEDAETLLLIGEGATQYARWNSVSQIFTFVINTVCPDVLKADPLAWQAAYLSGSILQEKYNRPQAADEFTAALKINPQAAEVYVALAYAFIEGHEFDEAGKMIERALEINPRLLDALLTRCDLELINGQVHQALKTAQSAAEINARSQLVLARLAACYLLLDGVPEREALAELFTVSDDAEPRADASRFTKLVTELLNHNPKPGYFLYELAQLMEMKRRFVFAEFAYLKTISLMPQLSGPKSSLGMLYMQMGKTDLALQTLDEAFKSDPYHVRVSNMRKVLGVLESYGAIVTDHFVIRYDSRADAILGQYMADYLEEIYPELVAQFGYEPPGKTQFEIYHDAKGLSAHQWFSARMIGLPWIQTIGASTGAVVALTSPTAMKEPFNWASVLKHELVHVFTLQQTKYKIPHWFTEALAVRSEGSARPQRFNQLLVKRVPQGEIYSLAELDGVFVRPKSSDNWNFAYCQSLLCADFMVEEFGADALKKLLTSYQNQRSTEAAIEECFQISLEEFETRYHAYLKKITASLKGYQTESTRSFSELKKAYEADKQNLNLAGEYAANLLQHRKKQEARELAQSVLSKDPAQPQAALTIARLELLSEDLPAALAIMQPALKAKTDDVEVLELAGKILLKQNQYPEALTIYEAAHKKYPSQTEWLQGLAIIYRQLKDEQKQKAALLKLVHLDPADVDSMLELMYLYQSEGDLKQTLHWGQAALQIDVLDPDTHECLAETALKLKQPELAIREFRVLLLLDAKNSQARYLLANTLFESGKKQAAETELDLLLKQNPEHAAGRKLKEKL